MEHRSTERATANDAKSLREIEKALPELIRRAEATGNYFLAYLLEMAVSECRRRKRTKRAAKSPS